MQAVLVKTEALAGGQFVILALVADDGLAFKGGEDGVAGGGFPERGSLRYVTDRW